MAWSSARYWARVAVASVLLLPVAAAVGPLVLLARRRGLRVRNPALLLWGVAVRRAGAVADGRDAGTRAAVAAVAGDADGETEDDKVEIKATAERPAVRGAAFGGADTGGTGMSGEATGGFDFAGMAEEIEGAAAAYAPEGAMKVLALLESMPDGLQSIAAAVNTIATASDERFPFDDAVADSLNSVYQQLLGAVQAMEEVGPAFRAAHAADIARHEEPRAGEEMWDVKNND